jgi:pimeloyl-ACP methyl ester carboxylesterase
MLLLFNYQHPTGGIEKNPPQLPMIQNATLREKAMPGRLVSSRARSDADGKLFITIKSATVAIAQRRTGLGSDHRQMVRNIVLSYQHIFKKSVNFYLLPCLFVLACAFSQVQAAAVEPQTSPPSREATPAASNHLPRYSELVSIGEQKFHLRRMGPNAAPANSPVVVLLSGPNQNFHADSAWFALLQPLLAQSYTVIAIDRLGNGFSDDADNLSYQRFSQDLASLLPAITDQNVILVSFASANISAQLFYQQAPKGPAASQVKAMILIDPDIPTPAALALYQGYPVDWYQQHLQQLLPELAKGVWNQRTLDKLKAERAEITALLNPEHQAQMDWDYFDQISQQRKTPKRQQQRAIEIAHYAKDLDLFAALPAISDIPVTVIDSDFETMDIAADPSQAGQLQLWQQQGSAWSKQLANTSGGQYLPLANSHHLVMFQHPEKILAAVDWLRIKISQPAAGTAGLKGSRP